MLVSTIKKNIAPLANFSLAVFFALSLVFFLYHIIYRQRVIPGVYLTGVGNLSGLGREDVGQKILSKFSQYENQEINFIFVDKQFTQTLESLGVGLDATASAQRVFKIARSGSLWQDLNEELRSLFSGAKIEPVYSLDPEQWSKTVLAMTQNLKGEQARFAYKEKLYIEPEIPGFNLEEPELEKEILGSLLSLKNPIVVNLETLTPKITASLLKDHFNDALNLLVNRPHLFHGSKQFYLTEKEFLDLMDVKENGLLLADLEKVKAYVSNLSSQIDRPAKALSFKEEDGGVKNLTIGQEGLKVEADAVSQKLLLALQSGKKEALEILVKKTKSDVSRNKFGIEELLAEGFSNFAGSIPGRVRNVKRSAAQMNGILVPPGEVFSFGQAIGEISAETGYDYAYIIKEGRTVLGTGGGVCQVSTTVFRAALNAGLPIMKRSAHAYRVHYYEQASPVGLDATVYPPTVDLQFKNDTAAYLLMTTEIEGEDLRIKLYGKSDGRKVELVGPTILSTSAAPAPFFQDDPTLPVGVKKQVDFAASGASVVFERIVRKNGEVLYQDKFVSNYRPWPAVYLVGTKT